MDNHADNLESDFDSQAANKESDLDNKAAKTEKSALLSRDKQDRKTK